METIEKKIEVDVPVHTAYNQWTQFEEFPEFMEGVESVQQLDDKHLHWAAKVGGKTKEWDAEIFEQIPDQRIAWRSQGGAMNSGRVDFRPLDESHSEVMLTLTYEPETMAELVGDKLGVLSNRVGGDLKRFKEFIESRGEESGGWRGSIEGRDVVSTATRPGEGEYLAGSFSQEELMQKMQEAGTPGPAHQALGSFVGSWKAEVTCWMDPSEPPNISHGTSTVGWILNKHFIQEDFEGEMMGTPFAGRLIMGFDNTKQKFVSVWVDSFNTSMSTSEGKADTGNKVITLEAKAVCPAKGRKDVPMKHVFRMLSKDKYCLEMFNDGQKAMEITYTRQ